MSILTDALIDTGKLVPLLAVIYFLVGFLEYRYGDRMNHYIMRLGALGPAAGALFGCIPQCGFSVIASALYVKRLISAGTLLAVFLSTSDEAVPVLLSMPDKIDMVGLLIFIKVVVAVITGMTVDHLIRLHDAAKTIKNGRSAVSYNEAVAGHPGCCSHDMHDKPSEVKMLILHPLLHTVKIFAFLFILTAMLNFSVEIIGKARFEAMFLGGTILQPVLASFIGLIPNCFASVLLAQLFVGGVISFGSLVAGLCSGAGLGLLVLVKENKDIMDTLRMIALLLGVSIFTGIVIQYIRV